MSYNVKDIARTLRENKRSKTPAVIFTGAGCSKSAGMPLAGELIQEINKKYKNNLKELSTEQRQDYGQCMTKLVPSEQKKTFNKIYRKIKN
ncbi:hypothetical protein [Acinetobacter sp. WCHAc060033]|uniref:hypothetical protein n=1 Tax=Acinetobacter sp. WCHAc060033 TaxID=2518624 RepID=UPI00148ECC48|nr:hypothetical protein [Acinetobacter sp. WCHAc060033]